MGAARVFAANLPGEVWQNAGNHRWATFCNTFSDRGSTKMHHFHIFPCDPFRYTHRWQVPLLEPCKLVCKDGPMQPEFLAPRLGLFSLIFTNGTTLISNDLAKWLKLSRVEAAGAFDSAMHLTRLGHFWCQRGSIQITIKRAGGFKIFQELFQHPLRYTTVM